MALTAGFLFTIFACGLWVLTFAWAVTQPVKTDRKYHVFVLILATVFWWLSETIAIRLGKYYYAEMPLVLPGGGSRNDSDLIYRALQWLVHKINGTVGIPNCLKPQPRWDIPFGVVAIEASLVFALARLSFVRVKDAGWRAAYATASVTALMFVTVTAILDPVVSATTWCGVDPDTGHAALNLKLWHWLTNETHQGYWFGVPLINYIAWFLANFVFAFVLRLDDGPGGIIRRYKRWGPYLLALGVTIVLLLTVLLVLKLGLDVIFLHGQDFLYHKLGIAHQDPLMPSRAWQFGLLGGLIAGAGVVIWTHARFNHKARLEWISSVVLLSVCAYCLIAMLLYAARGDSALAPIDERLWWVFIVAFAIVVIVICLPFLTTARRKLES